MENLKETLTKLSEDRFNNWTNIVNKLSDGAKRGYGEIELPNLTEETINKLKEEGLTVRLNSRITNSNVYIVSW